MRIWSKHVQLDWLNEFTRYVINTIFINYVNFILISEGESFVNE